MWLHGTWFAVVVDSYRTTTFQGPGAEPPEKKYWQTNFSSISAEGGQGFGPISAGRRNSLRTPLPHPCHHTSVSTKLLFHTTPLRDALSAYVVLCQPRRAAVMPPHMACHAMVCFVSACGAQSARACRRHAIIHHTVRQPAMPCAAPSAHTALICVKQ
eukprot:199423-Chlamydomonas_euryale.AAC.1